jgi:hypothetical protein
VLVLENSLSRRSVLTGAAAAAIGSLAVPFTAGQASAHCPSLPSSITAHSPDLFPEGVSWDSTRGAFLVGSSRWGNVSIVTGAAKVTELVPSLGTVSTLGVKVDLPRHRGLVAYSDFWVRQALPLPTPPVSGLAAFDLRSGAIIWNVDLDPGAPRTFANDLTIDHAGNAYVTNSVSSTIVRVTPKGKVSPFLTDDRLVAALVGANGIAFDPRGILLIARYDTGALFRVPLAHPEKMTQVELPGPIIGTDGMLMSPTGELLVVTNSIGAAVGVPGGVDAVSVLSSHDSWHSASYQRKVDPWPVGGPTTVTITPSGSYVMSGRVGVLLTGGSADVFTLRRL